MNMYKLTNYHQSVLIGIILSDAWLILSTSKNNAEVSKLNARLGFKQSLDHFYYFFFVFNIMSHYCSNFPSFIIGKRNNTNTYGLQFFSRTLPCFTKIYNVFYADGKKHIPLDIYDLLDPIALAN